VNIAQNSDGLQSVLLEQSWGPNTANSGPQLPKQVPGMLLVHASISQLPLQHAALPPPAGKPKSDSVVHS